MEKTQGKRLAKVLADSGFASRRKSEQVILDERVSVNGTTITHPAFFVDKDKDKILIDGKPLKKEEKKVTYLFHKPAGFVCSHNGSRNIYSFFGHEKFRLFSIGRLDKDTSGLLLLTNDGDLAQSLIHPSKKVPKEYLVKTNVLITDTHIAALQKGCKVQGVHVTPKKVKKVRKGTIKITVMEGRKHEVRLLMKHASLPVLSLSRIRLGNLLLGKLALGDYKKLSKEQVERIFDC